ncbi:hypothetical protein [Gordonia malaquae]|uniref:hypothetical protein n=1 Tax=Gordonia malaquae TaxID=410332 RepID=UPI0030194432
MMISPNTSESPVHAATHGVLAAAASVILGVAAHVLGGGFGGHGPSTAHVLVLMALAIVVGVVRANQVRLTEERRSRGRIHNDWIGTASAVVGGQIAAHLALSMLGHGSSVLPDARMTAWHAIAVPVVVVVLVLAERVERAFASRLADLTRLAAGVTVVAEVSWKPVFVDLPPSVSQDVFSSAGIRGPPVGHLVCTR